MFGHAMENYRAWPTEPVARRKMTGSSLLIGDYPEENFHK